MGPLGLGKERDGGKEEEKRIRAGFLGLAICTVATGTYVHAVGCNVYTGKREPFLCMRGTHCALNRLVCKREIASI